MLLKFLSGKSTEKESLQRNHPEMYKYFQQVWKVYLSHKLPNLSNKYFLVLALCFQPGCPHSLCMAGNKEQSCWYQGGPPLTYFPLPVPDPAKPWGGDCSSCKGQCPGHYKPGYMFKNMGTKMSSLTPHQLFSRMHSMRLLSQELIFWKIKLK